jgi:hypothetical protein
MLSVVHVRMYGYVNQHICCKSMPTYAKLRMNTRDAYMHTYIRVQKGDDSTSALTPRLRAWVGAMSLPQDQSTQIALALALNLYTSVNIIMEEDAKALMALPQVSSLKPGAKVVLRKKLAELQVCFLRISESMSESECVFM